MSRTPNYNKKLLKELKEYYDPQEMDEFGWWPDEDKKNTYTLRFKDHKGRKRSIVYDKNCDSIQFFR